MITQVCEVCRKLLGQHNMDELRRCARDRETRVQAEIDAIMEAAERRRLESTLVAR